MARISVSKDLIESLWIFLARLDPEPLKNGFEGREELEPEAHKEADRLCMKLLDLLENEDLISN